MRNWQREREDVRGDCVPDKELKFHCSPHGCEVGRAHWWIWWWRMPLSRGRWSRRTQTERLTPAVFSKTCWLTGSALTVFLPPPTGISAMRQSLHGKFSPVNGALSQSKGEKFLRRLPETHTSVHNNRNYWQKTDVYRRKLPISSQYCSLVIATLLLK